MKIESNYSQNFSTTSPQGHDPYDIGLEIDFRPMENLQDEYTTAGATCLGTCQSCGVTCLGTCNC